MLSQRVRSNAKWLIAVATHGLRQCVYVVWLCELFLISHTAFAAVPRLIRYQGQAVNAQGAPLEGTHTLMFLLYDAPTAGTIVWQETQQNIPLTAGAFSVLLGQVKPLETVDWGAKPLWLAIKVDSEPELAPRQQLTSVPLALRAERAEVADRIEGKQAADLLSRANHTGTQPSATITGTFAPAVISPQGPGSKLDADTVDGKHASELMPPRTLRIYQCPVSPSCGQASITVTCVGQLTTEPSCTALRAVPCGRTSTCCNPETLSCSSIGYLIPEN